MSGEPIITVVGNITADPELRFTGAGKAVAGFTLASTPRVKDGDQWVDGETTFLRCSAWETLAENVAESLTKGTRVIVQGAMSTRSYEHNGEQRTSLELRVDAIGPELRFATAKVSKAFRGQGGAGQRAPQQQQRQQGGDPWATPAPAQADPWASNGQPGF